MQMELMTVAVGDRHTVQLVAACEHCRHGAEQGWHILVPLTIMEKKPLRQSEMHLPLKRMRPV